jgi:hypothetical protein
VKVRGFRGKGRSVSRLEQADGVHPKSRLLNEPANFIFRVPAVIISPSDMMSKDFFPLRAECIRHRLGHMPSYKGASPRATVFLGRFCKASTSGVSELASCARPGVLGLCGSEEARVF